MPTGLSSGPAAERHRDILLVVLTLTTGVLDAVTFVRLGKVFSSVITGNLVLLGIAAGHQGGALALDAGLALAAAAAWRCCCWPRPRWACRAPRYDGWARSPRPT